MLAKKKKAEHLAKIFHWTFIPEGQYLGVLLKYAADGGEYEIRKGADLDELSPTPPSLQPERCVQACTHREDFSQAQGHPRRRLPRRTDHCPVTSGKKTIVDENQTI